MVRREPSREGMPRVALPRDGHRAEAVVWAVAAVFAAVFAAGQLITVLAVAPAAIAYHQGDAVVPAFVTLAAALGPLVLALAVLVADAVIFAVFVWLARRYWIGFAYVPPVIYLGLGSILIWLLASGFLSDLASGSR